MWEEEWPFFDQLEHHGFELKDCSNPTKKKSNSERGGSFLELPDHPAKAYSEFITKALNEYDPQKLHSTLLERCTSNVTIVKHTYSLTSPDAQEKGVSAYQFHNIDDFCNYMETWNLLVPDGVFQTTNPRVCVNCAPTFVFMSQLYFSGQKLGKRINLLEDSLQYYGCASYFTDLLNCKDAVDFETRGSLSIFVNTKGLIERLELYFCLPWMKMAEDKGSNPLSWFVPLQPFFPSN